MVYIEKAFKPVLFKVEIWKIDSKVLFLQGILAKIFRLLKTNLRKRKETKNEIQILQA